MEEIDKRLRETTDVCLTTHAAWTVNKKDGVARENLQEAVHELRKVAARLEIEMAISERDEMAAKPLPIPPHRSSKRRPGEFQDFGQDDDSAGNGPGDQGYSGQQGAQESGIARTMRRRRPGGHGGGHGGGGHHGGGHSGGGQPGGNGNNGNNNGNIGG